jgi:hypothetical protein
MANPNQFPWVPQTQFARIPYGQFPGDVWEGDLHNERNSRGLIANVTTVSQVTEVLIGANNPGDSVGIYIDGALFPVTAGANAGATALALEIYLEAQAILASVVSVVTVDTATVSITFADDQPHVVTEYSPSATTATVSTPTVAVGQQRIRFGYGVARQATGVSINTTKVIKPTSLSDIFAGVIFRTPSSGIPDASVLALDPDYDVNYLPPGFAYSLGWRDMGICVEYVGDAPTETDPVYWICTGTDAGKWRVNDGGTAGTSEVVTLTLTTTAADLVAFNYDGLPDLSIASASGTEATDAADLYAQWLSSAAYAAIGSIVDNLDGTLTITFFDDTTHAFTDNSGGTSSIAEAVDTAAVAAIPATAQLMPNLSWGRPTNSGGEVPCAYLRLDNP